MVMATIYVSIETCGEIGGFCPPAYGYIVRIPIIMPELMASVESAMAQNSLSAIPVEYATPRISGW